MSMSREAKKEIETFLQKGEKIGAIKHLKDNYGFSLEEARVIVEALDQHTSPDKNPEEHLGPPVLNEALKSDVTDLLIDRDKVAAIKHVKESLNISLNQAKDLVEEIERALFPGHASTRRHGPLRLHGGVVVLIFIVLGAVFLGISGYLFVQQSQTIEKSELITGKVIQMDTDSEGMSAPVIEYEWDGKTWMYASKTRTNPPSYEVNEEVPIYVNREDPADIILNTFSGRWLGIAILGLFGLFFVGIPLLVSWIIMRQSS